MNTNTDNLIADKLLRMELTNIRKSKGLTQKQLSEKCGLSTSTISSIETSELKSTSLRSLIAYTTALGVELYIKEKSQEEQ